ncbi:hypothetical protein LCGC14_1819970 [marine sediment metagenome]|uniref:Uncharacterized protein n=1 Tax=marine sediment metagenome TaxID=412755 RepID=A0A0F9GJC5_9ZZZZ
MKILPEVEYKISTYPSKFIGYQSKNKNRGEIKIYITSLWKWVHSWRWTKYFVEDETTEIMLDDFINEMVFTVIIERICLERAFQKIRMRERCKPLSKFRCKMEKIAYLMCEDLIEIFEKESD